MSDPNSPYAPPRADLVSSSGDGSSPSLDPNNIDIGAAFSYAMRAQNRWQELLIVGLVALIPIAGQAAVYGWMSRQMDDIANGRAGDGPPALQFSEDLSRGWVPLAGMITSVLGVMLPLFCFMCVGAVGVGAAGSVGGGGGDAINAVMPFFMIITQLFQFGITIGLNLVMPEIKRRAFTGDWFPLGKFMSSGRVILARPKLYIITIIGHFVGGFVGGLGFFLCCVGMLVTLPFGYAVVAHILAQWRAVAQNAEAELGEPA